MKIIFLDVDGVLNASFTEGIFKNGRTGLDPKLVTIWNTIPERVECKVVLISTWRLIPYWRNILRDAGVKGEFIGRTPYLKGMTVPRGSEVHAWLKENPKVTKFCVIDDSRPFLKNQKVFRPLDGLTQQMADEIVQYLNENP